MSIIIPGVQVITCDNPSPMTLEGTNTYVICDPGGGNAVVVDPGPVGHTAHQRAVIEAIGSRAVSTILLTHRHRDHTGAAGAFRAALQAPVRGVDPALCQPGPDGQSADPLRHGETVAAGSASLQVLHTPGHTSDSVCFWLPEHQAMITGDTILGRGTTMLDFPDGTLTDYLASLAMLSDYHDTAVLPAHGPLQPDLSATAQTYLRHRQERLDQAEKLLQQHGELTAEELGELIYGDNAPVSPEVIRKITAAQLDHLRRS